MKGYRSFLLVLTTAGLLAGCSSPMITMKMLTRDRSTVYIRENGKVAGIFFESFDREYYDGEELRDYVETEVSDQNAKRGKNDVQINYFKVKNGLAKVGLLFSDLEAYNTFNVSDFQDGETQEMLEVCGEKKIKSFYTTDGERIGQDEMELEDTRLVIGNEPIQVKIDGKILYTTKDVELNEDHEDEATLSGDGYSCLIYQPD